MRKTAVIYKSKYGATKRYAEWIAKDLNAELFEAAGMEAAKLAQYDMVVYGGGVYADGVSGVKLVMKNPCKDLVVFTVGLTDPASGDFSALIKNNSLGNTKVFHLMGALDFENLKPLHKIGLSVLKKMLSKKDEKELTIIERTIIGSHGQKVDFVDRAAVAPIVEYVKK